MVVEFLLLQYIDKMFDVRGAGPASSGSGRENTVEFPQLQPVSWTWSFTRLLCATTDAHGRYSLAVLRRWSTSLCCRSDQFHLSASTFFRALYTGTGPGAVSTETRLPYFDASVGLHGETCLSPPPLPLPPSPLPLSSLSSPSPSSPLPTQTHYIAQSGTERDALGVFDAGYDSYDEMGSSNPASTSLASTQESCEHHVVSGPSAECPSALDGLYRPSAKFHHSGPLPLLHRHDVCVGEDNASLADALSVSLKAPEATSASCRGTSQQNIAFQMFLQLQTLRRLLSRLVAAGVSLRAFWHFTQVSSHRESTTPPLLPRATVIVSALRRHDRANPLRDGRGFSWLEEVQTG